MTFQLFRAQPFRFGAEFLRQTIERGSAIVYDRPGLFWNTGPPQLFAVRLHEFYNLSWIHSGRGLRRACSESRLLRLLGCRQNLLRTVGETVDLLGFGRLSFIGIESRINAAQGGFQRDTRFLPGIDQGPIQSGKKKNRSPAPLKMFFNFGEIVEVIFHWRNYGAFAFEIFFLKDPSLRCFSRGSFEPSQGVSTFCRGE